MPHTSEIKRIATKLTEELSTARLVLSKAFCGHNVSVEQSSSPFPDNLPSKVQVLPDINVFRVSWEEAQTVLNAPNLMELVCKQELAVRYEKDACGWPTVVELNAIPQLPVKMGETPAMYEEREQEIIHTLERLRGLVK